MRRHSPAPLTRRAAGLALAAALAALGLPALAPAAHAATLTQVTSFGSNPGNLQMFRYVPTGVPANAPVVVAMHGCTQSAAAYDDEPGWTALADRWKFVLVLPQQTSANNSNSCFNWFESGDIARGAGEALSIKQMVDKTKADLSVDPGRVFATGLSAGGAMTSVVVATYPDVFAGGAVVAGLPYRCATTLSTALSCMSPGVDKTPRAWGDLVRGASAHTGPWPRMSVWHGDADATVKVMNATELVQQWTDVHGADQVADVSDTVRGYPHKVYRNAAGAPVVESFTLTGMGHGTPIDPGTATDSCGTPAAYVLDVDICSSYHIGRWFGLDAGSTGTGDTVAPTTSITAPTAGATVSGAVSVQAAATDAVGVSRVELLVDGAVLASDTTAPYEASWSTTSVANGSHTLSSRAYDAAGNAGTSAAVGVTVSNTTSGGGGTSETFSDRDASGDLFDTAGWTAGGWTASTTDHTGTTGSRSAYGYASSGSGCVTGLKTQRLSRSVTLGASPRLSYSRRLDLYAAVNTSTTAGFRVTVDGTAVDSRTVTYSSYKDAAWVDRTGLDLSAWAGRTVTLAFESTANSTVCIEVYAKNLVDDVSITG